MSRSIDVPGTAELGIELFLLVNASKTHSTLKPPACRPELILEETHQIRTEHIRDTYTSITLMVNNSKAGFLIWERVRSTLTSESRLQGLSISCQSQLALLIPRFCCYVSCTVCRETVFVRKERCFDCWQQTEESAAGVLVFVKTFSVF